MAQFLTNLVLYFIVFNSAAAATLSPKIVVDLVLKNGSEAKILFYQSRLSEIELQYAESVFDTRFSNKSGYSRSQLESLSGLSNEEDRSWMSTTAISKSFASGTRLSFGYNYTNLDSTLNPFNSNIRSPNLFENKTSLELKQSLAQNSFGLTDRYNVKIKKLGVQRDQLGYKEDVENLVLDTLALFWRCYSAKKQLEESIKAREILKRLFAVVSRKKKLGAADISDLKRTEAELSEQDTLVKLASDAYLSSLENLNVKMNGRYIPGEEVIFLVENELPPPPANTTRNEGTQIDRANRISELKLEAAAIERRAAEYSDLPRLDFVGRYARNGVDESNSSSFSRMWQGQKPEFYAGVELEYIFGSKITRGEKQYRRRLETIAQTQLNLDQQKNFFNKQSSERAVQSLYLRAKNAGDIRKARAQVVKALESKYRQGRIELSQLLQDYRLSFSTDTRFAEAIGDYHIALNRLAAANDELVKD